MGYHIDYCVGENVCCSSQIEIADRIFYVKLFSAAPSRYFSGDQEGIIQKEISEDEFDLWLNALADNASEVMEIRKKLTLGKKY